MQALKVDKLLDKFRGEINNFIDNYLNSAKQGSKSFVKSEEMFRKVNIYIKNYVFIDFPLQNLDLREYLSSTQKETPVYDLFAVAVINNIYYYLFIYYCYYYYYNLF